VAFVNSRQVTMPLAAEVADLARRIDELAGVAAAPALAGEARELAIALVGEDVGAGLLTGVMSALNDRLARRLIELVKRRHRLPAAGWCWLSMGSEGRGEQTFVTDQDNGLLFSASDDGEAQALRPLFLAMAQEVNSALAACGFPLCAGGIMAGNERWCLSVQEWQQHFSAWVLTPEPEALLNATIFFDFRALYGDESLATGLRQHLQRLAPQAGGFLHMLAAQAVAIEPPLGRVRDFVVEEGQGAKVDLKKYGARLFVDAARVLALAAGVAPVGTVARLRQAGPLMAMTAEDVAASAFAFQLLQRHRLLDQHAKLSGGLPGDNLLDTDGLNEFDRRVLIESLKQARRLQRHLQKAFRLEGL
jgi:CBS domain-containing protein